MSYNDQHSEEFDLYLSNSLSDEQKQAFENKLSQDKAFSEAFYVHKLLVHGIKEHSREQLKNHLKENGKIQYWGENIWPRSMRMAAAAVLVIFIGLYAVIHFYLPPIDKNNIAIQTKTTPEPITAPLDSVKETMKAPEIALDERAPKEDINYKQAEIAEFNSDEVLIEAIEQDVAGVEAEAMDYQSPYKVLSEKKISDTIVSARTIYFAEVDYKDNAYSQNKSLSNKKKSAQLPAQTSNSVQEEALNKLLLDDTSGNAKKEGKKSADVSKPDKTIVIEYWSSPVNFKGYRYDKNVLRLYSLKDQNAQVFIYNNQMYVRHDGNVYVIQPCPDACVYRAEPDIEIVRLILAQP